MIQDKEIAADFTDYLPGTLVARLPERDALREAMQHLNSLQRAVVSFLPPYIAEDEELITRDSYASLRSGAFLFADVSGFTALSELLQRRSGAEGTETLTSVINDYFAAMLEVLAKSDGQLLKFAGDALLAFWVGGSERETLAACRKAVRTGLRMQRAMREKFQPIQHDRIRELLGADHQAQLTMSIGVARGKLLEALVGNNQQRDHIIMGQLPGDAMQAEGVGVRDEVIVSADLADALRDQFPEQRALEDGFCQIVDAFGEHLDDYELELPVRRRAKTTALFDLEQANLLGQLHTVFAKVKAISRYVPPTVLHELVVSEDYHLASENRPTVTMFVHCTGFAEMLESWGEEHFGLVTSLLRRYYNIIQQIVHAHGGTLARTDPYKLGTKLLITFGAPIAHSDDPQRAVAAALEMNYQLAKFNARISEELPEAQRREAYVYQRIGITQGETYAGEVGWKQRREYTVMGDDVNLSARLMARAEYGQVLISSQVYKRVAHEIEAEALDPVHLKGKSQPVQVYAVIRAASMLRGYEFEKDMPFVGHDMFMLSLGMTLKQAAMNRRRAVALVGDAGIGKTRIASQLAQQAENAGFQIAWVNCHSRDTRKTIWASLVAQLLGLNTAQPAEGRKQLEARLKELGLRQLYSTLSVMVFGVPSSENENRISSASASPNDSNRFNDLLEKIKEMSPEERKNSGLFGLARRRAESTSDPQAALLESGSLWRQAEKRTNLPDSLALFLQSYTAKQPILFVIDDLHQHQDNLASIDLLKHVLQKVTQARLVVVVTFEPIIMPDIDIQTLIVPDLNRDETNLVAMAILRASELGPRLSDLLWERTSGRPLFIESLLRTLVDEGYIEDASGHAELKADADMASLPENVRELVISRVDRLSSRLKHVLNAAAVLGENFTVDELSAVTELTDRSEVSALLAELLKAQLLTEREKDTYTFRHGMTQVVVYETLSRAQRLKLHRLATQYWRGKTGAEARPVTLAYHLMKSGLLPQAMEVVTAAAQEAEQKQDIDGAIELYTHAQSIFPDEKSIHTQLERLRHLQTRE